MTRHLTYIVILLSLFAMVLLAVGSYAAESQTTRRVYEIGEITIKGKVKRPNIYYVTRKSMTDEGLQALVRATLKKIEDEAVRPISKLEAEQLIQVIEKGHN